MNIKKKLLLGFVWRMLFSLSLFILNIAFARYFGAVESGKVYLITTTLSLYIICSSINIETGIGFYAAAKKVNLTTSLFAGLLFTVISVMVLLMFQYIPGFRDYFSDRNWDWYYSIFYITGNLLVSIFCALFYAYNNYVWPNVTLACCMLLLTAFFFCNLFGMDLFAWGAAVLACLVPIGVASLERGLRIRDVTLASVEQLSTNP